MPEKSDNKTPVCEERTYTADALKEKGVKVEPCTEAVLDRLDVLLSKMDDARKIDQSDRKRGVNRLLAHVTF